MSRKLKYSRSDYKSQQDKAELMQTFGEQPLESDQLPPRRKKFPSSAHKLNKWYYNLLFLLFVALVIFLFWYGNNFSH